ncbi:hypothetical protein MTO96_012680 [Rhipicephalus appendiculatus]
MLLTTKFFAVQVSLLAVAGLPTTDDTCPLPADTIYLSAADLHVRTLILNFCVDAPTHRQLRMFVTSLTEPIKHPLQYFFDSGHGATRATMLLTTKFFFAVQVSLLAVAGLPTTDDTCPLPADTIYLSAADLHVRTLILNFCVDAPTHRQLRMFMTSLTEPIKHPLQHFFDSGHGATRATMLLTTKFFFAVQVSLLAVAGLPTTDDTCPLPADTIYLSAADLHVQTLILNFCVDAPTHRQLRMFVTSLTEPIKHPLQHFFDSGHGATRATMLLTTKFFFAVQVSLLAVAGLPTTDDTCPLPADTIYLSAADLHVRTLILNFCVDAPTHRQLRMFVTSLTEPIKDPRQHFFDSGHGATRATMLLTTKLFFAVQLKTPNDEASSVKRTAYRRDQRDDVGRETNDPRHHEHCDSRRDDMERLRRKRTTVRAVVTRIINEMTTLNRRNQRQLVS